MTDPADEATSEASVAPSPQPKISRDDVIAAVVHGALQRFPLNLASTGRYFAPSGEPAVNGTARPS